MSHPAEESMKVKFMDGRANILKWSLLEGEKNEFLSEVVYPVVNAIHNVYVYF